METAIFDPLEAFETRLKEQHLAKTEAFFESLVKQSGVDIEKNRETVRQYNACKENVGKLTTKRNWLRFFRVLACITIILIPLVIWKLTPMIRALKKEIEEADQKAEELLNEAQRQMAPLNALFTDQDALRLIEETMPLLTFAPCFSAEQETDMKVNYDFSVQDDVERSSVDVLAGHYNENPFLFEKKKIHTMGVETYHGYKTIHWTERYRDSKGNWHTRTQSQTLHATVTKPKPYYHTQVVLSYCAQGGPELSFTRDATNLDRKSEKQIERYVKKGERKLQKLNEEAVEENDDFTSMSNSEFEVLFDALDRTDEVQFRTLFTPLAQTNMVDLLLSKTGYGDDFHFLKAKRTNRIITQHSQGRPLLLSPDAYTSYSFDIIKSNFEGKNTDFFKAVYFDFAPLLAIPMYQERPVHSLKPIPDLSQQYSLKQFETLANAANPSHMVHPETKTEAILKSSFVRSKDGVDETCITAYSYDIAKRLDFVPMLGGDGRMHSVPVEWDDYLPLKAENHFLVARSEQTNSSIASRNGLSIFHKS
ncbi:MAG: hypothetical protein E7453_03260 [Ruminococcaceae bacterium]|nr:hypothetical protein [Oscillospiraceae bacterium]